MNKYKKDDNNLGVLETSSSALRAYKQQRELRRKKDRRISDLEKRVERLEKLLDANI